MANRERGEFTLSAGETRYTLRLTTNACCELEDFASGRTWDQVMGGIQKGSFRDVRLLLWAALRDHHSDIATDDPASLKAVGRIIDEMGGLPGLLTQLEAFMALNADTGETADDKTRGKNKGARPRKAAGTGGNSTEMPSAAA